MPVAASSASVRAGMYTTVVAVGSALLDQSMSRGSLPSAPWPVRYCRRRAAERCVSDAPSRLPRPARP